MIVYPLARTNVVKAKILFFYYDSEREERI